MAASTASVALSLSMSNEDSGLTDMTQSEFDAFKSNGTHTTTGETHFSAASSRSSRDTKSRSSRGSKEDDAKKIKKRKKKKSLKKDRKDRDDGTAESGTGTGVSESSPSPVYEKSDALFEKMLDAMGGEFTQSEFGDFSEAEVETHFELKDLDWDGQENMSKKSGKSDTASTKTPATNSTGFTRSTRLTSDAPALTGNGKVTFDNIEFADENLFDEGFNRNQPEDPFQDYDDDDDSVLSGMTGLTGVFSGVHAPVCDDEYDDDEGYLSEILPIQMQAQTQMQMEMQNRVVSSSAATRNQAVSKELRFSSVQVRHYERILTLNPSTIQGPSIGIGWKFSGQSTDPLDTYEAARGPTRPSERLVLNREQREDLLLELGFTKKQIAVGVRDNTKGKKQRRQTVQNLKAEKIEEALEDAGKRVKRILNSFAKRKV